MYTDLLELLSKPQKSSEEEILKALEYYPDNDPHTVQMTKELFEKQSELNTYCYYNKNALYHAIESGYSDNVIRILLRKGALPYIAANHAVEINDNAMFEKIYEKTQIKIEPIEPDARKILQKVKQNFYEGCMLNFKADQHSNYSPQSLKTYLTEYIRSTENIEKLFLLNRFYNARKYYGNQLKNNPELSLESEKLIEIYKIKYYKFFCVCKERFVAALNKINDPVDWNLEKRLTEYQLYKDPTKDDIKRVAKLAVEQEVKILEDLKNLDKSDKSAAKGLLNLYQNGSKNATNATNATNDKQNKRYKKG
ncbi:MAG: hypothetical protein WC748_05570 [Legionellales bacterium]|jgi:hypothetical protein